MSFQKGQKLAKCCIIAVICKGFMVICSVVGSHRSDIYDCSACMIITRCWHQFVNDAGCILHLTTIGNGQSSIYLKAKCEQHFQ